MSYDNLKFGVILSDVFSQNEINSDLTEKNLTLIETFDKERYDIVWVGSRQLAKQDPLNIPVSFITKCLARNKNIKLGLLLTPTKKLHVQMEVILDLLQRFTDRLEFCILIKPSTNLSSARKLTEQLLLHLEKTNILIGSETSPIAAQIAGHYGIGLYTGAATSPGGKNALASIWEVYARYLKDSGCPSLRKYWSIAGPMHISNTKKNAKKDTIELIRNSPGFKIASRNLVEEKIDLVQSTTLGPPGDAVKTIKTLQQLSGGFGTFLFHHHAWANTELTLNSYQTVAEKVFKHFQK